MLCYLSEDINNKVFFFKFSCLYMGLYFFQPAFFLFAGFGHCICCWKLSLEVWWSLAEHSFKIGALRVDLDLCMYGWGWLQALL